MQHLQDHPSDIGAMRYNAATGSFEALVSVMTSDGEMKIATDYPAPLDTSFGEAIAGLRREAILSLDRPDTMRSRHLPEAMADDPSKNANPIHWFFGQLFGNRAA